MKVCSPLLHFISSRTQHILSVVLQSQLCLQTIQNSSASFKLSVPFYSLDTTACLFLPMIQNRPPNSSLTACSRHQFLCCRALPYRPPSSRPAPPAPGSTRAAHFRHAALVRLRPSEPGTQTPQTGRAENRSVRTAGNTPASYAQRRTRLLRDSLQSSLSTHEHKLLLERRVVQTHRLH